MAKFSHCKKKKNIPNFYFLRASLNHQDFILPNRYAKNIYEDETPWRELTNSREDISS